MENVVYLISDIIRYFPSNSSFGFAFAQLSLVLSLGYYQSEVCQCRKYLVVTKNNGMASAQETPVLPGYGCQIGSDPVEFSRTKLEVAATKLCKSSGCDLDKIVLKVSTAEESLNYRCVCTFQILPKSECVVVEDPDSSEAKSIHDASLNPSPIPTSHRVATIPTPNNTRASTCSAQASASFQHQSRLLKLISGDLVYAMRNQFKPVWIGGETFPVANRRIQKAMRTLIRALNTVGEHVVGDNCYQISSLTDNLTGAKFVTSWDEEDMYVTLIYDSPFGDKKGWKIAAQAIMAQLSATGVIGRAKGSMLTVGKDGYGLRDTLHVNNGSFAVGTSWDYTALTKPIFSDKEETVHVFYQKPIDAFQHPNPITMRKALDWMGGVIDSIADEIDRECPLPRGIRMVEMYCGCGAHTVALASTRRKRFESIVAVELDKRLVEFCNMNVYMNEVESFTMVTENDAGFWAREAMRTHKNAFGDSERPTEDHARTILDYDVLLVDPPRQGLDQQVINLAVHGLYKHLIYISCGADALARDLKLLSEYFEVADMCLTDLFPRTDSVESLVHLRRKKASAAPSDLTFTRSKSAN